MDERLQAWVRIFFDKFNNAGHKLYSIILFPTVSWYELVMHGLQMH